MFQRILVPLDGSKRAEQALPVAVRLARASGGSIILLQAASPLVDYHHYVYERYKRGLALAVPYESSPTDPSTFEQEMIDVTLDEVQSYLDMTSRSNELAGVEVQTQALVGPVVENILSAAQRPHADLVVMCSHGYTGFERWRLGSVAQKVARHSAIPVLILYEDASISDLHAGSHRPIRVQVGLDGSTFAEEALVPAAHLAVALAAPAQGALHLTRVLPLPPMSGYEQIEVLAIARNQALAEVKAYLKTVEQRLHEGDLASLNLLVTSSVTVNMDIADTLIRIAETGPSLKEGEEVNGYEATALATHGRGGIQRWMVGSVTDRMLHAAKLPLLIVRPQKAQVAHENAGKTAGS